MGRSSDVDHIAKDVRLRLWNRLGTFDGGRQQLHHYVRLACRVACIDYKRNSSTRFLEGVRKPVEEPSGHEPLLPSYDDESALHIVERRIALQRRMRLLSPVSRTAVEAYLYYGNWDEAEEALGIPSRTLQSRFESALRMLRTSLSEEALLPPQE